MELRYDWKTFQNVFHPQQRKTALLNTNTSGPIYCVVDGNVIISIQSEGEDLSEWLGCPSEDIVAHFENREVIVFDSEKVDAVFLRSKDCDHYHDQIDFIRKESVPSFSTVKTSKHLVPANRPNHFVLAGINSWWRKMLPASYGIYVHLEDQEPTDLIVLFRGGKIESFHEPCLAAVAGRMSRDPAQVMKYLSEKYMLPIQGIFAQSSDWQIWSQKQDPWREVAISIRTNKTRLYPKSLGLSMLVWGRAYLGL